MYPGGCMYSFDDQEEEVPVIEIIDLDDFILWIKQQSFTLALIQLGKNFFNEPEKYIDTWDASDSDEISDDDIFEELIPYLYPDENNIDKFYMLSADAQTILGEVTNRLIYIFLNQLVDAGSLEMCWNKESNDFMWRVSLK